MRFDRDGNVKNKRMIRDGWMSERVTKQQRLRLPGAELITAGAGPPISQPTFAETKHKPSPYSVCSMLQHAGQGHSKCCRRSSQMRLGIAICCLYL